MSESFRSTPTEQPWSGASRSTNGNAFQSSAPSGGYLSSTDANNEVGKTVLIGLLGGILSAVGYVIYRRLPEEQKERLHQQVRTQVQQRVSEIRSSFNI